MATTELERLLRDVAAGRVAPGAAARRLQGSTFVDLGGVTLDLGRAHRTGAPEVVFAEGKDEEQLATLARACRDRSHRMLFTRLRPAHVDALLAALPGARHHARSRTLVFEPAKRPRGRAGLTIVSAGASDAPVAEEVLVTARFLGLAPVLLQDCGVAGLHRLLSRLGALRRARVVVAVAGMDGALPTVVAGLVPAPVIAVPTSVGYGPGGSGLTPLLTMLASCAPGLTVVNVDNGVGAAFAAARILGARR